MDFLIKSAAIAYITFIWLNTNAIYDYCKWILIKFKIFKKYKEFSEDQNVNINFPDYLIINYTDNFICRLITCPICITFWASIILYHSWISLASACASLLIYKLIVHEN